MINCNGIIKQSSEIVVETNRGFLYGDAVFETIRVTQSILFLEDVGEAYYNVDRMMWTLSRAGKLEKIKGLIIGGFTSMKDSDPSFGMDIREIMLEKVAHLNIPVAFGFL